MKIYWFILMFICASSLCCEKKEKAEDKPVPVKKHVQINKIPTFIPQIIVIVHDSKTKCFKVNENGDFVGQPDDWEWENF